MVVGSLLSYWEGNFSGAMLNFRRVILYDLQVDLFFQDFQTSRHFFDLFLNWVEAIKPELLSVEPKSGPPGLNCKSFSKSELIHRPKILLLWMKLHHVSIDMYTSQVVWKISLVRYIKAGDPLPDLDPNYPQLWEIKTSFRRTYQSRT